MKDCETCNQLVVRDMQHDDNPLTFQANTSIGADIPRFEQRSQSVFFNPPTESGIQVGTYLVTFSNGNTIQLTDPLLATISFYENLGSSVRRIDNIALGSTNTQPPTNDPVGDFVKWTTGGFDEFITNLDQFGKDTITNIEAVGTGIETDIIAIQEGGEQFGKDVVTNVDQFAKDAAANLEALRLEGERFTAKLVKDAQDAAAFAVKTATDAANATLKAAQDAANATLAAAALAAEELAANAAKAATDAAAAVAKGAVEGTKGFQKNLLIGGAVAVGLVLVVVALK